MLKASYQKLPCVWESQSLDFVVSFNGEVWKKTAGVISSERT